MFQESVFCVVSYDSLCDEQSVQGLCLLSCELRWRYVTYVGNVSSNKMDYPYRPLVFWLAVTHCGFGLRYVTPHETVFYLQQVCQTQVNPLNPVFNHYPASVY